MGEYERAKTRERETGAVRQREKKRAGEKGGRERGGGKKEKPERKGMGERSSKET